MLGLSLVDASRMASANPAAFLRMDGRRGTIAPGMVADLVHLDEALRVRRVWIAGKLYDYR
jgi:N-acetylglucosamine-6-phosphate deacetylase